MRRTPCFLKACLLLTIAASTTAGWGQTIGTPLGTQDPSRQRGFVLKRTVRRVILDVVVTDSEGRAVTGLTKKDFSVAEDKKSQRVLSFDSYTMDPSQDAALPKPPPMPPNTFINLPKEPERGPLYVIVYDAVNMSGVMEGGANSQPHARQELKDFLADKPAGSRFALFIYSDGLHLAQGFTTDPQQLLDVFDVNRKNAAHVPWNFLYARNYGPDNFASPINVLTFLGHYLEGLPGRKNLIWMASSWPVSMPLLGVTNASMAAQGFSGNGGGNDNPAIKEAIRTLTAAQISVYPIDVDGPSSLPDTLADQIADDTGGHAYYNTNDLKGALAKATDRGSSYYELSYSPANEKEDGKIRHIHVELKKPGYQLAYRRYYYTENPEDGTKKPDEMDDHPVATQQGDSLFAYMEHGAPMAHQIVFSAHITAQTAPALATPAQMAELVEQPGYFHKRRRNKPVKLPAPVELQTYAIDYVVIDRAAGTPMGATAEEKAVLELAAGAYDVEGKLMNGIAQDAVRIPAQGQPDRNENSIFRAHQTIDVPAGSAWIRVAVRDLKNDRIGTLEVPLPLALEPAMAKVNP